MRNWGDIAISHAAYRRVLAEMADAERAAKRTIAVSMAIGLLLAFMAPPALFWCDSPREFISIGVFYVATALLLRLRVVDSKSAAESARAARRRLYHRKP